MSFWKALFGGGKSSEGEAPAGAVRSVEHEGFLIEATPYLENGQYQVAGTISKTIDGVRKEHKFIRADRCPAIEDAADMSIRKGKQIVEQVGDRVFG